jgi:hypothetical protein
VKKKQTKKTSKHTTPKARTLKALNRRQAKIARRYHPASRCAKRKNKPTPKARRPKAQPCQHTRTRVLETRRPASTDHHKDPGLHEPDSRIRRRLKCLNCGHRWTEYTTSKATGPTGRWKDRRSLYTSSS